jgi:S-formylglutathione hydrolase FrmB
MQYRVVLPVSVTPGQRLPVVYLLHGGGGGFRDWTNDSDVARFAEPGLVLVMPEGGSSYYTNAADPPQDRYEDYIVRDLISDVESRFPVATGRSNRAIVGVSMGGFGAVKLALRHPELFIFAGGLSSAIDVPRRGLSFKRLHQSRHFISIFGSAGSQTRRDNDPFVLVTERRPRSRAVFFPDLRRPREPAPAEPRIRRSARGASLSARVSHYSRRSRVEPVECVASRPVSQPCGTHEAERVVIPDSLSTAADVCG